jgi:hypothetical protein
MAHTNDLAKLRAEYKRIAKQDPGTWTDDDRISVTYYRADVAPPADLSVMAAPYLVRQWTANMHSLDAYFADHNEFPRAAGTGSQTAEPEALRRLVTWVETQRRAIRADRRCTYQRRRLENVPGFVEHSHDGVWTAQFESYRRYLDTHPGVPRYRSKDSAERSNASRAAKQRAIERAGTMPEDRAERLRTLRIWT